MFTHISSLPSEEGFYVCRCIDKRGNLSYRIDEYRHPSVFQEKHEGIVEGFQLDYGNSLKTEAWMKLNDDYYSHIIKFDKNKKASIMVKGLELNISLGDIKMVSDGNPLIYQYPLTCDWDGEVFTSYINIYEFENNGNYDHKLVIDGRLEDVIKDSNDPFFKEYMGLYFENYFIRTFLLPDINNP